MKNNLLIAVLLTLSGLFLLDCMGIAIKYLRNDYPAAVLSVYRNFFGMIPCMFVLFLSSRWHENGRSIIIKEILDRNFMSQSNIIIQNHFMNVYL